MDAPTVSAAFPVQTGAPTVSAAVLVQTGAPTVSAAFLVQTGGLSLQSDLHRLHGPRALPNSANRTMKLGPCLVPSAAVLHLLKGYKQALMLQVGHYAWIGHAVPCWCLLVMLCAVLTLSSFLTTSLKKWASTAGSATVAYAVIVAA